MKIWIPTHIDSVEDLLYLPELSNKEKKERTVRCDRSGNTRTYLGNIGFLDMDNDRCDIVLSPALCNMHLLTLLVRLASEY